MTQRIDNAEIIEDPPQAPTKLIFAAWVKLEDAGGETHEYRLVGADEIGDQQNYISIDSPIAKALLGKSVDDSVDVSTPSGARELTIIDIRYPPR
jgi:transcription elongation factor GreB